MSRLMEWLRGLWSRWPDRRSRVRFHDLLEQALATGDRLSLRVEAWERALLQSPHGGGRCGAEPQGSNESTQRIGRI